MPFESASLLQRCLAPGVRWMGGRRYRRKFAWICGLLALPLLLLLGLWLSEVQAVIGFAASERVGLTYLRPLHALEHALLRPPSDEAQHQAWLQRLRHGEWALSRANQTRAINLGVESEFERLHAELIALMNQPMRHTTAALGRAQLAQEALRAAVGDRSKLVLDPDLDTYYLMLVVLNQLPALQSTLAELRAHIGDGSASDSRRRTQLATLLTEQVRELALSLQRAERARPTADWPADLRQAQARFSANAQLLVETLKASADATVLQDLARPLAEAGVALWQVAASSLDERLAARIQHKRLQMTAMLVLLTLTVLVLFYLLAAFYIGVMKVVRGLESASHNLSGAEIELPAGSRDELGDVVQSFQRIARQLRHEWQQAREEGGRAASAEAALRASELQLRQIVDSAMDAVIAFDAQDRIVGWNPQAERLFGWSRDEALGRELGPLILPPGQQPSHEAGLREFAQSGRWAVLNRTTEVLLMHRSRGSFPAEQSLGVSCSDGVHLFSLYVHDISARLRTQQQLAQQATRLMLLQRVAASANLARDAEASLYEALVLICELGHWQLGHAYGVDPAAPDRLLPLRDWVGADPRRHQAFLAATRVSPFVQGIGLPGRVLAQGRPAWIPDLSQDDNFPRAEAAAQSQLRCGFAIPIRCGAQIHAVLEFYASEVREHDEAWLDTLAHLGAQLGQVYERQRAQAALQAAKEAAETQSRAMRARLIEIARELREFDPTQSSDADWRDLADRIEALAEASAVGTPAQPLR